MAVWLIHYQLSAQNRDRYLTWFHDVHVPEKLARPRYDWAVHYRVEQTGADQYIALFGGATSRVFYDPSPSQLKPTQDALTREMIAYRENTQMMILSNEWASAPDTATIDYDAGVRSKYISLIAFEQSADDQQVGAWCAQQFFPLLEHHSSVRAIYKLLASTGQSRHVVLCENNARNQLVDAVFTEAAPPGGLGITTRIVQARRCWPPD